MLMFLYKVQEGMKADGFFWFCALAGSGLFVLQFIMTLLLGISEDLDVGNEGVDAGNFKWLSKQALTGFVMIFGWVGLTCRKEYSFSIMASVLIASAAGLSAVFILGAIFRLAKKLRSQGSVFRIEDTIGKEATVYQDIPKAGSGKISLSLNNLTYEIDAISSHSDALLSFTKVQIIDKMDDKTVVVIPTN